MTESLEYRNAAVNSASPVQLVCMLYETVVRDLTRAVNAIESGDVETRAIQVKHVLLVLQQLEAFLDMANGGDAAMNLSQFYSVARTRIMQAHAHIDASIFREQIALFLEVRAAWEQVEARETRRGTVPVAADAAPQPGSSPLSCSV